MNEWGEKKMENKIAKLASNANSRGIMLNHTWSWVGFFAAGGAVVAAFSA